MGPADHRSGLVYHADVIHKKGTCIVPGSDLGDDPFPVFFRQGSKGPGQGKGFHREKG